MSGDVRLFVAEKPAVAKDLAAAMGARKSSSRPCYEGNFEGGPVWVSWCIGHLVEVAEPHEHDPAWKRWSAEQLPMLPRQLVLRPVKRTADHFRSLAALLRDGRVGEVINACDAGREGELIFRYVYGLAGCTRPIRRFWVSSLTSSAIAKGLANLRPGADYEPLAAAARCRAEADWLVGMNATRGLTLRGGTLLSVGRVQTPTLAMVVDREAAIEAFVPDDYWQVQAVAHPAGSGAGSGGGSGAGSKAASGGRGQGRGQPAAKSSDSGGQAEDQGRPTAFGVRWVGSVDGSTPGAPAGVDEVAEEGAHDPEAEVGEAAGGESEGADANKAAAPDRLTSAAAAAALAARLEGAEGVVSVVQRTRKHVPPPPLYDLTALQREANARYGVSAKDTLDTAQSLYERHKLLTYPRTDSRHLSQDVARTLPDVLDALAQAPASWAVDAGRLAANPARNVLRDRRFVDDAQVSDHHAILPTTKVPDLAKLTGLERRIYELVARRVLAVHAPDAIWAHGRIEVVAVGERLEARGRTCLDPGWEAVDPPRRAPPGAPGKGSSARGNGAAGGRGGASGGGGGTGRGPELEPEVELPPVEVGQPITLREAEVTAHQTRPPPRYTEASMLGAMERAGRELDEAALRAAMRDGGLGTPATRAATLETLIDRAYIAREGRALVPLPAGRALIGALPVAALKSARLTGEWEARLQAMARGREDPMAFRRDIRAFVRDAVAEIMGAPSMAPIEAAAPSWRAAAGKKRSGRAAAGSSERGRGRGVAKAGAGAARAGVSRSGSASRAAGASKTPGGRSARGSAGKAAPARGAGASWAGGDERRIEYDDDRNDSNGFGSGGAASGGAGARTWSTGLSGRRGDSGRWGGASASLDSEVAPPVVSAASRATASVPTRAAASVPAASPASSAKAPGDLTRVASGGAASPVGLKCPVCGEGKLMLGRAAWGCDRWREGCRFVVGFEFEGVVVPADEAARLVGRARQTRLFARVEGRKARLVLEGGVVRWGFGA